MKIKVISSGLLTTIQDAGRPGWRPSGVPAGGAADGLSHRIANYIVGNEADKATLEIAGGGFSARVEQSGWLAAFGAGGDFFIDEHKAGSGRSVFAPEGSKLEIRSNAGGNYACLATPGGWDLPEVLGSRSTCLSAGFGGLEGRGLRKGDVLKAASSCLPDRFKWPEEQSRSSVRTGKWFADASIFCPKPASSERNGTLIRILRGPEFHWWSTAVRRQFFKTSFTVSSRRDRMGVRLEMAPGEQIFLQLRAFGAMLSTAVCSGTIQVPPDGFPIVLLADAQTTGGYPRIGQVVAVDIPGLAQTPPGQTIRFQEVTLDEAEQLFFAQEKMLQKIRLAAQLYLDSPPFFR